MATWGDGEIHSRDWIVDVAKYLQWTCTVLEHKYQTRVIGNGGIRLGINYSVSNETK